MLFCRPGASKNDPKLTPIRNRKRHRKKTPKKSISTYLERRSAWPHGLKFSLERRSRRPGRKSALERPVQPPRAPRHLTEILYTRVFPSIPLTMVLSALQGKCICRSFGSLCCTGVLALQRKCTCRSFGSFCCTGVLALQRRCTCRSFGSFCCIGATF